MLASELDHRDPFRRERHGVAVTMAALLVACGNASSTASPSIPRRARSDQRRNAREELRADARIVSAPVHPRFAEVSRSAQRATTAMMVNAGLADPWVGNTLPSVM